MATKVLLIGPYPKSSAGSLRYRWEQYIPDFEKAGIELTIRGFQPLATFRPGVKKTALGTVRIVLSGIIGHIQAMRRAKDYDVVIVQREAMPFGPPIFERWLHRQGIRYIYDYDDALYVKNTLYRSALHRFLAWPSKTDEIIRMSDLVIGGNSTLVDYAKQLHDKVVLIPTVPYTNVYVPEPQPEHDKVVIGWSGGRGSIDNMDMIARTLQKLAKSYRIKVVVAGDGRFTLDGVDASGTDWTFPMDDRQVWSVLKTFDIGLMPLNDTALNRGKSGFKALLYMSTGIPPVISPVGVNCEIVQDGVNGFLANTEDEWYDKLRRLIEDRGLRKQLGDKARESAVLHWSALNEAPRLIELIRQQAGQ